MTVQPTWVKNINGSPWVYTNCPNSCRLIYPASSNLEDLLDTISAWLQGAVDAGYNFSVDGVSQARGWTQVGTTTGKRGFSSPANTFGTKFLNLDAAATAGTLRVQACESISSVALGTTIAIPSTNNAYHQRYDLAAGGQLYIAATPEYAIFQSITPAGMGSTTGNGWSGVAGFTCDNVDQGDIGSRFAFICGALFGGGTAPTFNSPAFGVPRTIFDGTGALTPFCQCTLSFGSFGHTTGSIYSKIASALLSQSLNFNSKAFVSDCNLYSSSGLTWTSVGKLGILETIKLTTAGGFMDIARLKVDANNVLNDSGTEKEFVLFSNSGSKNCLAVLR